ncbi:MAG: ABC transporter permease [Bacteroidota bacterium]
MIRNYLKIACRNFIRNKTYSLINVLGLASSMFCAIVIILWINDELSYESFWPNSERIYRLVQAPEFNDGTVFRVATNPAPMPEFLQERLSGIEEYTRFRPLDGKALVRYQEAQFYEDVTYVDSTFFTVFQIPFLAGNADALYDPNATVITTQIAEKYFGKDWQQEDILGKIITVNDQGGFAVSGVIETLSPNTHLNIDILLPFRKLYDYGSLDWDNHYYYAYFLLDNGVDAQSLSQQIAEVTANRNDIDGDAFYMQSLNDIHLYSDFDIDLYGSTELRYPYVNIFTLIALAIMLMACINFMNLSTAQSERRAKEIGLRKTVGSLRRHIVGQLLGESVLLSLLASLIAGLAVLLALPYFNNIVDKSIYLSSEKWPLGVTFLLGVVAIGLLAGSYPALFLSRFKPVQVLKGGLPAHQGGSMFRRVLVVTQFAVSIILISGTAIVYQQFQHMLAKDLGYDKDLLVYMPARGDIMDNYAGFKNDLLQQPLIDHVTATSDIPTHTTRATIVDWDGKSEDDQIVFHHFTVDFDYVATMGLEIVEGRDFSPDFPADTANFIINEEAARLMGFTSPVGEKLTVYDKAGTIVGVVKDFNFKSLHQKLEPLVLHMYYSPSYILAKAAPGNITTLLNATETAWEKHNPNYPFEYHFLDEEYGRLYRSEQRMANLFNYFTFFALFIACLGLIGLINHMLEKRKKEVSIRKVLGASISSILSLLSKEYIRLILIAFLIAIPIAHYFISDWLDNYAYQVDVQWWLYLVPGALVLLFALLSVGGQTLKAAHQNPVENLRNE